MGNNKKVCLNCYLPLSNLFSIPLQKLTNSSYWSDIEKTRENIPKTKFGAGCKEQNKNAMHGVPQLGDFTDGYGNKVAKIGIHQIAGYIHVRNFVKAGFIKLYSWTSVKSTMLFTLLILTLVSW